MERILIIGGGIAGLTAGIYGQLNGYETEIFEMHTIPGGECTAWKRGGYTFDGCIHWMMGTKPGTALNSVWRQTGALDDTVEIILNDEFCRVEMGSRTAILYRNIDKTEKHWIEMFPKDGRAIRELCRAARAFRRMEMPVEQPMDQMGGLAAMKMGLKMLPMMGQMAKYNKITVAELASGFQDPLLRALIQNLMPVQYSAMPLLATIASLDDGDSGYPAGGSLPVALRMEKHYHRLGGKAHYNARVERVLVEGSRAVGIRLADGSEHQADWVVSCADGRATLDKLLGGQFKDETMERLYADREAYPVYATVQVSVGIAADLAGRPHLVSAETAAPVDAGGISHKRVGLKNYSFDKQMAPAGKSVITATLSADFDWWKTKKADPNAYRAENERVGREVCAVIESRYPETKGKIEQVDVATPMTYVRYCDAWRGSWMSFMNTPKGTVRSLPGNLPGLDRFYMAGQWTMFPGGLPGAALAGKWVIQRIAAGQKK